MKAGGEKGGLEKDSPRAAPWLGASAGSESRGAAVLLRDRGCKAGAGALLLALLNAEATTPLPPTPPRSLAAAAQGGPGAPSHLLLPQGCSPRVSRGCS